MTTEKKTQTAEDFAKARFATLNNGSIAMRSAPGSMRPWSTNDGGYYLSWFTDEEMAKIGWEIYESHSDLGAY